MEQMLELANLEMVCNDNPKGGVTPIICELKIRAV